MWIGDLLGFRDCIVCKKIGKACWTRPRVSFAKWSVFDNRMWQLIRQSLWEPDKPLRYRLILYFYCSILPAFNRLSRDFWSQRYFCLLKSWCVSLPWVCLIVFWTDLHFWHPEYCLAEFPQCTYSGKNTFLVCLLQPVQWCHLMLPSSYAVRNKECFLLLYPTGAEVPAKFNLTRVLYFWTTI